MTAALALTGQGTETGLSSGGLHCHPCLFNLLPVLSAKPAWR